METKLAIWGKRARAKSDTLVPCTTTSSLERGGHRRSPHKGDAVMTGEERTRCPFCRGPIDGATAADAAEIHQQIRVLQERLQQIQERLYPVHHPPGLWGGYGAEETLEDSGG
jgi:hypothetical protein